MILLRRLLAIFLLSTSLAPVAQAGLVPRDVSFNFYENFINCCLVHGPGASYQADFVSSNSAVELPEVATLDGVARFSFDVQEHDIIIKFLGEPRYWPIENQQYPFIVLWGLGPYNDIAVTSNLADYDRGWINWHGDPGYMGIGWSGTTQAGDYIDIHVLPVPEPETDALIGIGLVGLIAWRKRKA